jgi:hypothetical protein
MQKVKKTYNNFSPILQTGLQVINSMGWNVHKALQTSRIFALNLEENPESSVKEV